MRDDPIVIRETQTNRVRRERRSSAEKQMVQVRREENGEANGEAQIKFLEKRKTDERKRKRRRK
ncbi:hypothetical protein L484_015755 [Morus notabilis]|uniref:Uncharacterized protein n=1 Tax=Morus notabilis TaxID=981085 RepID=W9S7F9_9ROSA|nr:hypothetical protein L484_016129 [Morus notabilis]EXC15952.1 hypothetical protein L484_015755 [Morus notabilis]